MEKFLKIVRTIAILLIVILISVIAFFGIYIQKDGIWENILPDYKLGMEFDGIRELRFGLDNTEESKEVYVDENGNYKGDVLTALNSATELAEETTEEAATETTEEVATEAEVDVVNGYTKEQRTVKLNPDDKINIETFEKTKKIIQKRLENEDLYEYNIRQDSITGEIVLEVPDDENVELAKSLVTTVGEVTIIDSETGVILVENSHVKNANLLTGTLPAEEVEVVGETEETEEHDHDYYQAYLQLDFDAEGTEILKNISEQYVTTIGADGTQTAKMISVKLDNETLISTYFGEPLTTGSIQIPLGDPQEDLEEFYDLTERIVRVSNVVNTEELPLVYTITADSYIEPVMTENYEMILKVAFAIVILIVSLYMIIKYKLNGLKQAICAVGYIGLLLIVIRYTGVVFTYNSVIALFAAILINYVFSFKLLNKLKKENNRKIALKETMKELYLAIVPVCIIACIFTFMSSVIISSIGTVLFWGLLVQALFSLLALV